MKRSVSIPWLVGYRFGRAGKGSQLMSFISTISTAGIVLGVALLVLVVAVMNGFDRELRTKILSVVPQVSIYHREGIADWQAVQSEVEQAVAQQGLVASAPFVQLEGLISHRGEVQPVLLYGVHPELEPPVSHIDEYLEGAGSLEQWLSTPDAAILGKDLANKLQLAPGDSFSLVVPKTNSSGQAAGVRRLTLVGLLATGTELDQGMGLMDLSAAADLAPVPGRVSGVRLRLKDLFSAPMVARSSMDSLGFGYYASDWTRTHGNLYHAVQMSTSLVWLLLVLIIGIAVFNVVSTLVLAVVEKQRNIAILRTMGASPRQVLGIFVVQGGVIGTTGALLGIILGFGLTLVAERAVQAVEWLVGSKLLTSEIYPVSYLPIDNRLEDIVLIGVVAVVLSLLASLYPAWRASRLLPAEALRYD